MNSITANIMSILLWILMISFIALFFFGIYKLFASLIYILKNIKLFKYFFKNPLKPGNLIQISAIFFLLAAFIYELYLFSFGNINYGCSSGVLEYRSSAKKAVSMLNQAIQLNHVLEGEVSFDNVDEFAGMLGRRMSIINSNREYLKVNYGSDNETFRAFNENDIKKYDFTAYYDKPMFQTSDGIIYMFEKFESGCKIINEENPDNSSCIMVVDVNGFQKHNKMTVDSKNPQDRYKFVIDASKQIIRPVHTVTQNVLWDKN